jgi:mortality factor 4-like protein 1
VNLRCIGTFTTNSVMDSWDEWVPEDRVLKWTETNLQKQAQLKEAHNRKKPVRSSTSTSITTDKAHDGESRGRKRARDSSLDKAKVRGHKT